MISDFKSGEAVPFVMGKINWRTAKKQDVVNQAMASLSTTQTNVGVVETSDLPLREDDHFANEALLYASCDFE
jgi:hypothetical protein